MPLSFFIAISSIRLYMASVTWTSEPQPNNYDQNRNQLDQPTMSVPSPKDTNPPSPRSSTSQTPPVFTPMHHAPSMQREHVAGSPLVTTEGGRKASIGGGVGGRRMSGVIPSPSGRRGSGSVVTPGGQVVAYHTRTNVSLLSWLPKFGSGVGRAERREYEEMRKEEQRRVEEPDERLKMSHDGVVWC